MSSGKFCYSQNNENSSQTLHIIHVYSIFVLVIGKPMMDLFPIGQESQITLKYTKCRFIEYILYEYNTFKS